jgi:hypothetical protein
MISISGMEMKCSNLLVCFCIILYLAFCCCDLPPPRSTLPLSRRKRPENHHGIYSDLSNEPTCHPYRLFLLRLETVILLSQNEFPGRPCQSFSYHAGLPRDAGFSVINIGKVIRMVPGVPDGNLLLEDVSHVSRRCCILSLSISLEYLPQVWQMIRDSSAAFNDPS